MKRIGMMIFIAFTVSRDTWDHQEKRWHKTENKNNLENEYNSYNYGK